MGAIGLPAFVIYCETRLVPMPLIDFQDCFTPAGPRLVRCVDGSNPHFRVTHILDRRGCLYTLVPVGKHRAALSFLAKIWDWTLTFCRLEVVGPVTVEDLLEVARAWTNPDGRKLARHLRKLDPNAVFDEVLFREAWNAVAVALPDAEWEKDFRLSE
jgi:hypothetical protein